MNTLIKNHEINNFFNSLMQAYNNGVDAVIVQHNPWLGFAYALLTFMLINVTWVFFRSDSFAKFMEAEIVYS